MPVGLAIAASIPGPLHSGPGPQVDRPGNVMTDANQEAGAEDLADVRSALAGDDEAYARIVRRYQPLLFRQMHRFTRDRAVLDELVQEAFVEAWFSLKSYRAKAPFLHWLRRIATRVGYRYWKQLERRRRLDSAAREQAQAAPANPDAAPDDAGEVVFAYLERLPPPDRLVLTLSYLDECSTKEIADRTGWSPTLVRVRAHRARQRLKRILEDEGIER